MSDEERERLLLALATAAALLAKNKPGPALGVIHLLISRYEEKKDGQSEKTV